MQDWFPLNKSERKVIRNKHLEDCATLAIELAYTPVFPGKLYLTRSTGLTEGKLKNITLESGKIITYLELAEGEFTAPTYTWLPRSVSCREFREQLTLNIGRSREVRVKLGKDLRGTFIDREGAQIIRDARDIFCSADCRIEQQRRLLSVKGTESLVRHLVGRRKTVIFLGKWDHQKPSLKFRLCSS